MATTVTFEGTRFSTADTSTSGGTWDKYGSTQTPILELNFILQGPSEQSNKVSNTTGGIQFLATSSVDFATTPKTMIAKVQVSTVASIDKTVARGMSYEMGDDDTDNYQYYMVGSGTGDDYPVNAGWWTIIIDPNVAAYRDATPGATPTLTALQWVGMYVDITALAKAENVIHSALDYVDNGKGLLMTGTAGALIDFVVEDEDVNATAGEYDNRWRLAARSNGSSSVFDAVAWWTLGSSATALGLTDSNKVVKWTAGRVDTSFHGLRLNLENASTDIALDSCTFVSDGAYATNDTRADFEVVGTSGVATVDGCSFLNFNNVDFTSAASMDGGRIEAQLLTQSSADIENVTIATSSLTSIATLQDPTFGTTTDLHDVTFVQNGAGHGLEIDTATSYTFTNIFGLNVAAGYGANTTDSAGIDVTASSGTVTITVSGGDTPTYKTAGATVVINSDVTVTFATMKDNSEVRIYEAIVEENTDISFTSIGTISSAGSGFGDFAADDIVRVSGSDDNDDTYTVVTASASTLTVVPETITTESAGATVKIKKTNQTELAGIENATSGTTDDRSFAASIASGTLVDYVIHNWNATEPFYQTIRIIEFTWPSSVQTININQLVDRNAQ